MLSMTIKIIKTLLFIKCIIATTTLTTLRVSRPRQHHMYIHNVMQYALIYYRCIDKNIEYHTFVSVWTYAVGTYTKVCTRIDIITRPRTFLQYPLEVKKITHKSSIGFAGKIHFKLSNALGQVLGRPCVCTRRANVLIDICRRICAGLIKSTGLYSIGGRPICRTILTCVWT